MLNAQINAYAICYNRSTKKKNAIMFKYCNAVKLKKKCAQLHAKYGAVGGWTWPTSRSFVHLNHYANQWNFYSLPRLFYFKPIFL